VHVAVGAAGELRHALPESLLAGSGLATDTEVALRSSGGMAKADRARTADALA